MNNILRTGILALATVMVLTSQAENLRLHYDKPAKYFEEALVIGNGKLGGIVYGGIDCDSISLNDITLWSGMPDTTTYTQDFKSALTEVREALDKEDYAGADKANRALQGHYSENYLPLGRLYIRKHGAKSSAEINRQLDISEAVATTTDDSFAREYFASSPDSVIAVSINARQKAKLDFSIDFSSLLPHTVSVEGNEIIVDGYASYHSYPNYYNAIPNQEKHLYDPSKGIHFRTVILVDAPGSHIKADGNSITVKGGKSAAIYVSNETSFNGFDKNPVTNGKEYKQVAQNNVSKARAKGYDALRRNHINDYKSLFDRVSLDLGKTAPEIASLPTDVQLKNYTLKGQHNPELEALYFQYGRYLLISSSRTPGVPANLQGLWNESLLPPWSSNYTTNINLPENYWGVNVTNLSELHQPLLDYIGQLAANGTRSAKTFYGVDRGWSLGHNTDIWAMTNPVGLQSGDPVWACWNMGGAWIASHIWDHYLFTQDMDFLRKYYPYLKGAADFCLGWMVEKDGKLMTSPGTSPENQFLTDNGKRVATSYGVTSDLAMIRQCLSDAVAAAKVLDTDAAFVAEAQEALTQLAPYQIDSRGAIQEWYHPFKEAEPNHRHQSHLYGLFPGNHISPDKTPDLAKAAHKTLELRGTESTGWSTGWRINLYARLLDADMAYATYRKLLKYISPDKYKGDDAVRGGGTYPNLLDAHSPFQIDGNFGGTAGVAEMLIQSDGSSITLLPAVPEKWNTGNVRGLKARGGYTVDFGWSDGKVTKATVASDMGGTTVLNINGKPYDVSLNPGQALTLDFK